MTEALFADRYRLERRLGVGGMSTVQLAFDTRLERYVAVKLLAEHLAADDGFVARFRREALAAARLVHPNVVQVYDFDRDGDDVFMVMERLEGQSLDRIIKDAAGVGVGFKEALRITTAVCDAMAYAHERGIVHADFKPANVFMTREGVVKVLDFGIARAVKRSDLGDGPDTLFDPGTLNALTPAYAGYEVMEGQEPDVRDDIYAIGCVFYELLTGKHPFNRMSAEEAARVNLLAIRPKELSQSQWDMLRLALWFRRDYRPTTVTQFITGLQRKRKSALLYFGLAAAASLVIVGMVSTMHVMTTHDAAVSEALVSNDTTQIEAVMPWLRGLTPERRATVFLDGAARAGLIKYFTERVDASVDPERERYDYAKAEALIKELWELLPDSQAVKALSDRVSTRRSYALQRESFAPALIAVADPNTLISDARLQQFAFSLRTPSMKKSKGVPQNGESITDLINVLERDNSATLAYNAGVSEISLEPPPGAVHAKREAPRAVALESLRLASTAVKSGNIEEALKLATSAKQVAPKVPETVAASERYARYVEIDDQLQTRERLSTHHLKFKIWRVSKLAPDEMPAVTQRWTGDLVARIQASKDPALTAHLSQVGRALFGENLVLDEPLRQVAAEARPQE